MVWNNVLNIPEQLDGADVIGRVSWLKISEQLDVHIECWTRIQKVRTYQINKLLDFCFLVKLQRRFDQRRPAKLHNKAHNRVDYNKWRALDHFSALSRSLVSAV